MPLVLVGVEPDMAKEGVRDPKTHRTPEQKRQDTKKRQKSPEEVRKRVARNKARRHAIKAGKVKKGDGKDIDHIKPLSRGGSSAVSNLRVKNASKNRSHRLG